MKLFCSSTLFWGQPIETIAKNCHAAHLQGIEIWYEQARFFNMSPQSIVNALKTYGLDCTVHAASWDLNLCSINKGIRNQSFEEIHQSILFAKEIEALDITLHPGRLSSVPLLQPWHEQLMEQTMTQLDLLAIEESVILSIELMEPIKKELYTTADHLNALIAPCSEAIQTTFDVAHSCLVDLFHDFQTLNRVNKIHLSDATTTVYHVPLGEGKIHLAPLLSLLLQLDVPIVLEGFDPSLKGGMLQKHLSFLHEGYSRKELVF